MLQQIVISKSVNYLQKYLTWINQWPRTKAQYFVAMDIYEKDIAKLEVNLSDNNTGLLGAQANEY